MNNPARKICSFCGNYLSPDQSVCPNCGETALKAISLSDKTQSPYTTTQTPYTQAPYTQTPYTQTPYTQMPDPRTQTQYTTTIPSYAKTQTVLTRPRRPFDTVEDPVTVNQFQKTTSLFSGSSYSSPPHFGSASNRANPNNDTIKIVIYSVAALIVLIIFIVTFSGIAKSLKGPDLSAIYTEYCDPDWADLKSDGDCIEIDTNPNNINDFMYTDAYYAVEKINKELGLPDYVWDDMEKTRGLDGKQTERFEDIGVTVSWRYHPDTGLEVTYRKIK